MSPLGEVLSASEAADLVENSKTRSVATGSHLFVVGDKGHSLCIVLSGSFDVVLGQPGRNEMTVTNVGPGQIVGEIEVMTGALRVASLLATDESAVLELASETFDAMIKDNRPAATKLLRSISKTLARRLVSVNQRILDKAPAPMAAVEDEAGEPQEIGDAEMIPMDDEDLDVLDKLWG